MAKFKVGDIVKATRNEYGITNEFNKWIGEITKISGGKFSGRTISSEDRCKGEVFNNLVVGDFELMKEKKISWRATFENKS